MVCSCLLVVVALCCLVCDVGWLSFVGRCCLLRVVCGVVVCCLLFDVCCLWRVGVRFALCVAR